METIPFAKPFIGKEEEDAVLRVLRSGWLTTGGETAAFEKEFGEFFFSHGFSGGAPLYCMAVNSATSGLHLALEACGISEGDLVLLPSLTFTATAEVVRYLGAEPVFVDVKAGSFHMDPAAVEATLGRLARGLLPYPPRPGEKGAGFGPRGKAAAIMPVHYGGLPCDMDALLPTARKYGLKVIEDAAHSFPSILPGKDGNSGTRAAGLMGDAGVFSFYATKTITTGEGGMVVTRDGGLADRVKIMRSHGIDRSVWNRYTDTRASWRYEVIEPGFKYNIPDILSALGRAQLRRAMSLLETRRGLAARYDEAFSPGGRFLVPPTGAGDARHLYPLRLNPGALSTGRDAFAQRIQEAGVGVSVHFIPLHTMPYYKTRYSLEDDDFPETMNTYRASVSLPLWPGMTEDQTERVIEAVKNAADG